ncbi:MAG: EutN/CcmL family microcompartment protein [Myxococcales bacterium]|nr:EutN/CcmL family microcompartment protein [Myxococcales bacterium]
MILGLVQEPVVSTIKHPELAALALFVVQPILPDGSATGATFLAVDHAQAGPGDTVLVLREGGGIRQVLGRPKSPIRSLIVAVVDDVYLDDGSVAQGTR